MVECSVLTPNYYKDKVGTSGVGVGECFSSDVPGVEGVAGLNY